VCAARHTRLFVLVSRSPPSRQRAKKRARSRHRSTTNHFDTAVY